LIFSQASGMKSESMIIGTPKKMRSLVARILVIRGVRRHLVFERFHRSF